MSRGPGRRERWPEGSTPGVLHRSGLAAAAALALSLACAPPASEGARHWWEHVRVLASDSMRGRDTGSLEYLEAARYVAGEFRRYGVAPAGAPQAAAADSSVPYFQPVRFVRRKIREGESALSLEHDGHLTPLRLGEDATLSVGIEAASSITAPMTFVGYGLSVPEAGYDDLAGLDLHGRVAVYLRGGPDVLAAPLRAHAQATDVRWKALRAAGAVGVASISNPKHTDIPWERSAPMRLKPSLGLADSALDEMRDARVSVRINPAHADSFFRGTGHTLRELLALADHGRRLPVFPLPEVLHARTRYDRAIVESPNVVGVIPGQDSVLRNQYVVVSAHLDHLGVGPPVKGDSIYNGAMDNASGVASLIEIARFAAREGTRFRRSVVLLALTGEEKGLEGSRYFAAHPTVPAGAIVADLNLDMFLPIQPMRRVIALGLRESDLGDEFTRAARRAGVEVQDDPEPQRNAFIRSDQYCFVRRGVPALAFEIGYVPRSAEEARHLAWIHTRYHAPSDDLSQPVDLEAAAAFTRLLFDFTRDVANRDEPPHWKPTSYFRRFAGEAVASASAAGASQVPPRR